MIGTSPHVLDAPRHSDHLFKPTLYATAPRTTFDRASLARWRKQGVRRPRSAKVLKLVIIFFFLFYSACEVTFKAMEDNLSNFSLDTVAGAERKQICFVLFLSLLFYL